MYITKAAGNTNKQFLEKNLTQADELQKKIGNWHDYIIAADIMKDHTKKGNRMDSILKILKIKESKLKKKAVKGTHWAQFM